MLPGLLAVGDDVETGSLLFGHGDTHCVPFGLFEDLSLMQPACPELSREASRGGLGRLPAIVVCTVTPPKLARDSE